MEPREQKLKVTYSWSVGLLDTLNKMRFNHQMCDLTILLQDSTSIRAHSCVLSAASPFINSFIASSRNYNIDMKCFSPQIVKEVVNFIYTGELKVNREDLLMLQTVSATWQIPVLSELALGLVQKLIAPGSKLEIPKIVLLPSSTSNIVQSISPNRAQSILPNRAQSILPMLEDEQEQEIGSKPDANPLESVSKPTRKMMPVGVQNRSNTSEEHSGPSPVACFPHSQPPNKPRGTMNISPIVQTVTKPAAKLETVRQLRTQLLQKKYKSEHSEASNVCEAAPVASFPCSQTPNRPRRSVSRPKKFEDDDEDYLPDNERKGTAKKKKVPTATLR